MIEFSPAHPPTAQQVVVLRAFGSSLPSWMETLHQLYWLEDPEAMQTLKEAYDDEGIALKRDIGLTLLTPIELLTVTTDSIQDILDCPDIERAGVHSYAKEIVAHAKQRIQSQIVTHNKQDPLIMHVNSSPEETHLIRATQWLLSLGREGYPMSLGGCAIHCLDECFGVWGCLARQFPLSHLFSAREQMAKQLHRLSFFFGFPLEGS